MMEASNLKTWSSASIFFFECIFSFTALEFFGIMAPLKASKSEGGSHLGLEFNHEWRVRWQPNSRVRVRIHFSLFSKRM
ncbi:hypothetical protein AXF42_Ash012396 [Apostasia shenzhenica]|uniref:Uncharacterized protein n=1 Tax=Apostasia shenzhenica TaxID=1088818 RepID=A0A2I0AD29_9ASPA|nr:hypothetical protein AXF42_Ash012396 [Apostasia shenzhenica]